MKLNAETLADSSVIDKKKIYSLALDGDLINVISYLDTLDSASLSGEDLELKSNFENRFKFETDLNYPDQASRVEPLFSIYRKYWRDSFLQNKILDSILIKDLISFFSSEYKTEFLNNDNIDVTLDKYLKQYIESKKLKTTGFGKTGKFYDLLIWTSEKDTVYEFDIHEEKISSPVIFMEDFITLGWQEYATLGIHYPGGWANKESLFCVKKAYDLNSENFLISYLAHEGRHFSDYKIFPELSGEDLEYRAKLTELSLAKETLFKTLEFFIRNGNEKSDNPHAKANYRVIKDLSFGLFEKEYESDIETWKCLSKEKINAYCLKLMQTSTELLRKKINDQPNR